MTKYARLVELLLTLIERIIEIFERKRREKEYETKQEKASIAKNDPVAAFNDHFNSMCSNAEQSESEADKTGNNGS